MAAKQVIYLGHVQGVGFRYTAKQIASGYDVVGTVRNLPDGSVEMKVQAHDSEELEAFLEAVQESSLRGNIRGIKMLDLPALTGIRGFTISH